MASLARQDDSKLKKPNRNRNARWVIHLNSPSRPKIAIGRQTRATAESIRNFINDLEATSATGSSPAPATATWLASVDLKMRERLAKLGLCKSRGAGRNATLGELIERFRGEEKYAKHKPGTVEGHNTAIRSFEKYWGLNTRVSSIDRDTAIEFRKSLKAEGLAEATIRKRCAIASMILKYAARIQVIDRNPFDDADVPRSAVATEYYRPVSQAEALAILENLPSNQWKLLFALSRWGGLRVGSEPRQLLWADVNLDKGVMWVRSPKTEHHHGKDGRFVPVFPELESLLTECYHEAQEGEDLVLPFLVGRSDASLRKPLMKAIKLAGIEPWKRLWHNMRKTRQNELANSTGITQKDVCGVMGNSLAVASRHYVEHTEADAKRIASATRVQKRAQNPVEHTGTGRK